MMELATAEVGSAGAGGIAGAGCAGPSGIAGAGGARSNGIARAIGVVWPLALWLAAPLAEAAGPVYRTADAALAQTTITLTGHDLSVEQLAAIARHGAKVQLSPEALRQEADQYGLLLQAQAEGVPVYLLNRGGGLGRATVTLEGDALSPANRRKIGQRELAAFERGALEGDGPEIDAEEIVRAMMAVRANGMVLEAPSPQLAQLLLQMLNRGVTPVVRSRGTVGESDLYVLANICGAMVGRGDAYYRGVRMPAARALQRAGLMRLEPFALDSSTLANSNAYATALAALLVLDGRHALDWTDLTDAIDLNGMNGSITPLSTPVQRKRPSPWLNWDAGRVLDMVRGSYLFEADPQRILADADSLRASSIRQGAAWQSWAALRDSVVRQINSSDHNPVVSVGSPPPDAWESSTPQMMQYFVKGGEYSGGKTGYVVSSANWDPYPLANDIEAFSNALANVAVTVTQRIFRFQNPFFTVLKPQDVLPADSIDAPAPQGSATLTMSLWQEMQMLTPAVPASGVATDAQGNGDIESQAVLKAVRARQATDVFLHLLAQDLLTGAYWMDLRRLQSGSREFGAAPQAALTALRTLVPFAGPGAAHVPPAGAPAPLAYDFVKNTSVAAFYPPALQEPGLGFAR